MATRGWGWQEEMRSYYLMGTEFQFRKMKKSGDGWWWKLHNNVNVLMTFSCTLKNG